MSSFDIDLLRHNARDGDGNRIKAKFIPDSNDEEILWLEELKSESGRKIGYINITIEDSKKIIFINDMENYYREGKTTQPYKGIGNLFHQYVMYLRSLPKYEDYSVQLVVAYNTYVFHFMNGFRFEDRKKNEELESLIKSGRSLTASDFRGFPTSMYMPRAEILNRIRPYQIGVKPYFFHENKTHPEETKRSLPSSISLDSPPTPHTTPISNPTSTSATADHSSDPPLPKRKPPSSF